MNFTPTLVLQQDVFLVKWHFFLAYVIGIYIHLLNHKFCNVVKKSPFKIFLTTWAFKRYRNDNFWFWSMVTSPKIEEIFIIDVGCTKVLYCLLIHGPPRSPWLIVYWPVSLQCTCSGFSLKCEFSKNPWCPQVLYCLLSLLSLQRAPANITLPPFVSRYL